MSGIARILRSIGHDVTGSDVAGSPNVDDLRAAGIDVVIGHDPTLVVGADCVVISTAVPADDVEVVAARAAGIPVLRRTDMMTSLCGLRRTVAVAGAHGKTTTTALLASILAGSGFDPSYLVGAKVVALGTSARWGDGAWFAVEADESDGTFLELGAEAVVVTNVEPDHLDHWGSFDALVDGYRRFVLGATGPRVVCVDDPGAAALADEVGDCITYGTSDDAQARLTDVRTEGIHVSFTLEWRGQRLALQLAAPGVHNARNAAAAAVTAMALGASAADVTTALAGFRGVSRRFEPRGEAKGITFVDSYDHLPSEVASVLDAAREGGWRRIVCVFQPHRATRVRDLWRDFAHSFTGADLLAVSELYVPEGAQPIAGISGKLIVDAVLDAHPWASVAWLPSRPGLRTWLLATLRPGDLCLTLNAGDLTTLPDELLGALA